MATQYPAKKGAAFTVVFPILDNDGDLVTGALGLDSEISKDGGAFVDCTNEAAEIATSSGMYSLALTATEMTADIVAIIVKTTTADAKTTPIVIYTSAQTLDEIDANVDAILTDTGTTLETHLTDIKGTGFIKDTHSLPQCLTATGFSTHAAADIWSVVTRALTDKAGFSIAGVKTTLDDLNDITTAQVNAEVDTALADIHLDHLIQKTGAVSDLAPTASSFITNLAEAVDDFYNGLCIIFISGNLAGQARRISDYDGTTKTITVENAFTAAPADADSFIVHSIEILSGTGPTAAQVADAVWDEVIIDHTTAGSFGAKNQKVVPSETLADYKATGFSTHAPVDIWTVATRSLTDKADFSLSSAANLAIWHVLTADIVTADTIGLLLKTDIDATISSRSSHAAADIWTAASRELSTPDNYKADVSALALEATLERALGLTQENFYIDTCTYDSGKLTAARVRIYDSAANVGTDTGVTATYNVTVTWSGNDMASYKVVKA